MDFKIDAGFLVLQEELTALFSRLGEFLSQNTLPEEPSRRVEWFTWFLLLLALGLYLFLLREKGILSTFNKDQSLEEEDEAEEMRNFTRKLLSKDERIRSEVQRLGGRLGRRKVMTREFRAMEHGEEEDDLRKSFQKCLDLSPPLERGGSSDPVVITSSAKTLGHSNYPSDFEFCGGPLRTLSTSSERNEGGSSGPPVEITFLH